MRVLSGIIFRVYGGDNHYWKTSSRFGQIVSALISILLVFSVVWISEFEQLSPGVLKMVNWLWYYWDNAFQFNRYDGLLAGIIVYLISSIAEIHLFNRQTLFIVMNTIKMMAYSVIVVIIAVTGIQLIQEGQQSIDLLSMCLFIIPFLTTLVIGHKPVYLFFEHLTLLWLLAGHHSLPGLSIVTQLIFLIFRGMSYLILEKWAWLLTVYLPLGLSNFILWTERKLGHARD